MWHIDVSGDFSIGAEFFADEGTERRKDRVSWNRMFAIRKRRLVTRHHIVIARTMTVIGMRMAADNGKFVRDLSAPLAMFREKDAGGLRGDCLECASNFHRSIWLRVPHVLLRRPSFEKNENTRSGFRLASGLRSVISLQKIRQRQSTEQTG